MLPDATPPPLRVAVLDLYDGTPNEGMRALRTLLAANDRRFAGVPIVFDVFDVRQKAEVPGLDYDAYLSTGGPGSPFDGEGKAWEARYFELVEALWTYNEGRGAGQAEARKHILFICHSFQMMVRFFGLAQVVERVSPSFGVLPVHRTDEGRRDPLLAGLPEPFFAADFRAWQVVQPDHARLDALGASILCLEKIRHHVPLERAVMGIRLSAEMVGFQFHPEADPPGMSRHFRKPERSEKVIAEHGREKYYRILHRLDDPGYLARTYHTVVPRFLQAAVEGRRAASEARTLVARAGT